MSEATIQRTEVLHLPVEDVIPTPDNKRKMDPKSADIKELAASVREVGVLQPVLVRPHPTQKGKWDLRAGHRRLMASKLAERATVPAIVADLDDRRAAEITTIENLQREDLTLTEEAEQLQVMIDAGWDMEACAASIGKPVKWIHSRARLAKLSAKWKKQLTGKKADWPVSHFELVAQYPSATQDEVLRVIGHYWHRVPSLKDFSEDIGRVTNELGKAPFDVKDAELLPKAGACVPDCPKRRGHHPDLFLEIGTGDLPLKQDVCLDPKCWEAKTQARLDRILADAQAEDDRTIPVRRDRYYGLQRPQKGHNSSYATHYDTAKKTDPKAIPAIVVQSDNGKVGTKIWVKPYVNPYSGKPATKAGPKSMAQKREEKAKQRRRHARDAMWAIIEKMDPPDKPLTWWLDMVAAGAFRKKGYWTSKKLTSVVDDRKALDRMLWDQMRDGLAGDQHDGLFNKYDRDVSPARQGELRKLGEQLGISWTELMEKATEALPDPKSWAKQTKTTKKAKRVKKARKAKKVAA